MSSKFHEVWWLWSSSQEEWGGLRMAHFRKSVDGTLIFFIQGERPDRIGPRIWASVSKREGWIKVKQVRFPTRDEVRVAIEENAANKAKED